MENIPLFKFIPNYIPDQSGVFHTLTSEDIDDVISRFFTVFLCKKVGGNDE